MTVDTDISSFPAIFIISLERSAQRRLTMAAQLDALRLDYEFINGIDGRDLDLCNFPPYALWRRRLFFGRDLTPAEMGCLLSHRKAYQRMVDLDMDCAVILEDDAILQSAFPAVIRSLVSLPIKWDLVRFLARNKVLQQSRRVGCLFDNYFLLRPRKAYGGAYGYAIKQNAARVLLGCMRRNWLPIDILHGHVWRTGLETFAIWPSPVVPDMDICSTIGDGRFNKTIQLRGWKRCIYPFTRAAYKIYEQFGKRLATADSWFRDRRTRRQLESRAWER